MTSGCEICVLGPLRVRFANGREPVVKFRTRKAALLLTYLALHQGKTHSREFLIELLWPELEVAAGRDNLSTTLSALRRVLEPAGSPRLIESDPLTVRLCTDSVLVDANRFAGLVRRGLHTKLASDERHAALTEALALWDTPLPGCFDDWALEEQAQLEELLSQAREALETLPAAAEPIPAVPEVLVETTLPVRLSPFFGREAERERVGALLQTVRLLTLLGPGGVGKTSVALEVAREHATAFGRVVFVSLAELPIPALLLPTLRRALTDAPPAEDPLTQVIAALNDTPGKTLLLLDNLEHLLPVQDEDHNNEEKSRFGVARTVRQLLESCPGLVVLTTSRQPLGTEGEHQVPLLPLATATGVELFVERARTVRPDFTLTESNRGEIEAICTLLDGLPLALELAAAWVRVFSLGELRERLEKEVLWLQGKRSDLNPRQKSLEATLHWSWQLLSSEQKRLLAALSVFRGGWTVDAAEAIAPEPETLDLLFALVEKSLVLAEQGTSETRFRLLETIRQFATERLEESGETALVQQRQAAYFLKKVREWDRLISGPEQLRGWARFDLERDNLRAVLDQPLNPINFELAAVLGYSWFLSSNFREGRQWLERALTWDKKQDYPSLLAGALLALGTLERSQGEFGQAQQHLEQALLQFRAIDQVRGITFTLQHLGVVAQEQGKLSQAHEFYEEALGLCQAESLRMAKSNILNSLGILAIDEGKFEDAERLLQESLALHRTLQNRHMEAISLVNLGTVHAHRELWDAARACFEASLVIQREVGDRRGVGGLFINLARVAQKTGEREEAKKLCREAIACCQEIGSPLEVADALEIFAAVLAAEEDYKPAVVLRASVAALRQKLGVVVPQAKQSKAEAEQAMLRQRLGEEPFQRAWQEGTSLTPDQAAHQLSL